MIKIKGKDINELFINIAKKLIKNGKIRNVRGLKTLELNDAWLELDDTKNVVCSLKSRNLSLDYLKKEMAWYKSGNVNVSGIMKASQFWKHIANDNGTVNSNYGKLALKDIFSGKSQYAWCFEKLQEDKYTRQAIINYNQPIHKYSGNKDFVCTISQQFVVRNEKLDNIVLMRSNDLIYGLSYDIVWFNYLLTNLCKLLKIKSGKYYHYANSLHVYSKHFLMLENIAKEKYVAKM